MRPWLLRLISFGCVLTYLFVNTLRCDALEDLSEESDISLANQTPSKDETSRPVQPEHKCPPDCPICGIAKLPCPTANVVDAHRPACIGECSLLDSIAYPSPIRGSLDRPPRA
ncbi:MAG TPA: hypothetical protein VFE62_15555 [Gemmataceae bacterium]|nr:hypothetical protein [Gemmataceae bacterium]